jgi:hypothetical protein
MGKYQGDDQVMQIATYKLPPVAFHFTPPYGVYGKNFCHSSGNSASKSSEVSEVYVSNAKVG